MPTLLAEPHAIVAAGEPPKRIDEYAGRVSTSTDTVSLAVMRSPAGWTEPFQTPEFDEWSLVLRGTLVVEHDAGTLDVAAGQAVHVAAGERVRYATPSGAEYVSVCAPAFAPALVHREGPGPAA